MIKRLRRAANRNLTRLGFWLLRRGLHMDTGYAWSWHSNLAMTTHDEVLLAFPDMPHPIAHEIGNRGAAKFLRMAFGLNTNRAFEFRKFEQFWREEGAARQVAARQVAAREEDTRV